MPDVASKRCPACCPPGVALPAAAFARNRARPDGLQSTCRQCRQAVDRGRYAGHGEEMRRQTARARALRASEARRLYLAYLLAHPCPCGEVDPVVLEFHHTRDKRADVSKLLMDGATWERIESELACGEILCANCHRRAESLKRRDWRVRLLGRLANPTPPSFGGGLDRT